MRCRKIWSRWRSHQCRHNMAHARCMLDYLGSMHLCVCTRLRARLPTCTHAHSRTHRPTINTYFLATITTIRGRASVLRYTCITPLGKLYKFLCQPFNFFLYTRSSKVMKYLYTVKDRNLICFVESIKNLL